MSGLPDSPKTLQHGATSGAMDLAMSKKQSESTEHTPLAAGMADDLEAAGSGRVRPRLGRRQTFAQGEQFYPNKQTTWSIEDSNETMGDVEIVVNLLADLTPAGILPLSFGMRGTGYVTGFVLLAVFSGAAAFMLYIISRTIVLTGEVSYDRIWSKVVNRQTAWVPILTVVLVCFGNCLAYACFFGDLFSGAMPSLGLDFLTRTRCLLLLGCFPVAPLCMLKDLSALAPTSFGALIMVIYTVGMMVFRYVDGSYAVGGQYYDPAALAPAAAPGAAVDRHLFNFGTESLLLVNSLAIAFLCHYNGCKYYREFQKHTPGRFIGRVSTAFALIDVLFCLAMMAGFATFGAMANGVVLNNYAETDSLANIARFGMGVANMFSFPLMFSGLREAALALIIFVSPDMSSMCDQVWFQNSLSAGMVGLITFMAVLITDAGLVVGLVGSICGSAIIYVVPCLLYDCALKRFSSEGSHTVQVVLVRFIGCAGVVLMVAGAYATLAL